jgi:hypothetical protein
MSHLYVVIPISAEDRDGLNKWLSEYQQEIPAGITSRFPTPLEIRQVLTDMPDYTKEYPDSGRHFDVNIYETAFYNPARRDHQGRWAVINSSVIAFDENRPLDFCFHGGWDDLNLEILHRLTSYTGSLIMLNAADAIPILVSPDRTIPDLLDQWERLRTK